MSLFVSLLCGRIHVFSVVFQSGCLARLSGRTSSFVSLSPFICLPLSSSLGTASPFVSLLLSPSLDAWHGSLGGRIHLTQMVAVTPKSTAKSRASKALAPWSAVASSQLRLNPKFASALLACNCHGARCAGQRGEQAAEQEGRDALYRAYG